MIARIRKGNDFHVAWQIKRGGVAENLENVTDIKLERTIYGITTEHTLFTVSGDTITAEIPAEVQTHNGQYKLTLSYELVDTGMSDDDRKCKVAVYAFAIVDPLGPADDLLTVNVASDVSIGFKGDKGLSAYQVWLEDGNVGTEDDYFDYLRQPATDAAASISTLEQTVSGNEALRVTAEQGRRDEELLRVGAESARNDAEGLRDSAEDDRIEAEGIRDANETDRINAESDRVDAEDLRDQAEVAREEAEGLRQTNTTTAIQNAEEATTAANTAAGLANSAATEANTAAGDANDAADAANTAAGLADTARTELTTAVNTKLDEADGKIEEMNTTLSAYDGRVSQVESDIDQLAGEVSLFKEESNLKDAIQDSKIKDIENVLSTANLNQSAQLSVSGGSPLSLPKNAANGGMSVKLEGLTAENLVVNGDFRNGLTGWSLYTGNAVLAIEGDYLTYISNAQVQAITQTGKSFATGDKLYMYAIMKVDETSTGLTAGVALSGIGTILLPSVTVGVTDTVVSGIITTQSDLTSIIFGRADTVNKKVYLKKGARVINLTAAFGAGNEPTVEECDAIFGEYFEGVKSFEPTGRVRSVDKNGLNPTALYLTAPELRSNGTVKDEIRKGANGYEHVKRVGVGTSNGEVVTGGDFSDPTKWAVSGGTSIISNGTLKLIANAGIGANARQSKTITAGKIYRYKIDVLSLNGPVYLYVGSTIARIIDIPDLGKTISGFFLSSTGGVQIQLAKNLASNISAEFDNISIFEYNATEGVAIEGGEAVYGGNIHYTLATPVITPISYGGILNSAENGTAYHEPVVADAGVYDTKMDILLTDYPIATIEEIIKHENGVDIYLNVATAVIAGDGLSFTHPDLASGDLALFTYAYDKESTNGNITATFYDSNVVKIDTVTGKAYKIEDVITNGVLTRTLIEV